MSLVQGTPIPKPESLTQFVDPQSGRLADGGVKFLSAIREFIVGMNRVTPCAASGTNVLTLTPNTASPVIEGYVDYEMYGFTAAATSTGLLTATVVPRTGTLATLKVYKSAGAAQATTGDVVLGSNYWLIYVSTLDSSAGGFVLK